MTPRRSRDSWRGIVAELEQRELSTKNLHSNRIFIKCGHSMPIYLVEKAFPLAPDAFWASFCRSS